MVSPGPLTWPIQKKKFYPKDFLYWRKKKLFFSNKKLFFKWKKNFYHPFERVTLTWATHLTHQKEGLSTQKVFYSYLRNQFFMHEKKIFYTFLKNFLHLFRKKKQKKKQIFQMKIITNYFWKKQYSKERISFIFWKTIFLYFCRKVKALHLRCILF